MHTIDSIRDLYGHMQWADALVWKSVRSTPQAAGDPVLRERLQHLHGVQHAFFSIWCDMPLDMADLFASRDLPALQQWAGEYHRQAASFVAGVSDEQLRRSVHLPWSEELSGRFGTVHPTTFGETMIQVAMHSTYHRGQINTRIRELGGEPPLVDFIAWIWRGRPAAEWA